MKTIVLAVFSLQGNGAERVVQTLARNMNALGHQAHIVLFKDVIDLPLDDGVHVHKFPYGLYRSLPRKMRAKIAAFAFDKYVKKHIGMPDLVLSNLYPVDFILSQSRLPNLHFVMHNNTSQEYSLTGPDDVKIAKLTSVYAGKNCVCVSKGVEEDLRVLFGQGLNTRTIYNPVEPESILSQAAAAAAPPQKDFIVNVGKFKKAKRHDRLLRAYAQSGTPHDLVLVGTGPFQSEAQSLAQSLGIADRVHFVGFQKNPFPFIKAARLMVVSSEFEGLNMTILEAIVLGVPVVSTDCPSGPSEILPPRNLVYPPDDIAALAEKIADAAQRPETFRVDFSDTFKAEAVAREYLKLTTP
ncbi:glycosyltransferase [uncultured Sulfitobacter sp.]|jgi:glycosyltransferase involved in cell wall biosynthesis|uniref:glycosyltransferase n=1 Tax=uncultured Sulfitobacter sp. TaxID=191468 RepID=UPI0025990E0D|nr:glycosyltransferase [uncultured Sulfitobacter sp.]